MKGLIVYCLDRIIRRERRSCLHWYLSVLSRLIDTLDCYISKLKTFSAGFHSRFYVFLPPLSPLRLVIKKFGCASWQFSLRKGRFLSRSSRGLFKVFWQVAQNMNDTEIADTDDESPSSAALWSWVEKLNCNQSAVCKHCLPSLPNTFTSVDEAVWITCVQKPPHTQPQTHNVRL